MYGHLVRALRLAGKLGGYADGTEAVAPDEAALQWLARATEQWVRLTRQEVNVGNSAAWTLGEGHTARMLCLAALDRNISGNQAQCRKVVIFSGGPVPAAVGLFRPRGLRCALA